jgi:hypothetical protein
MILLAIGWYLRFSLSYRDVEELLAERGLLVDHVTVWRWVQRYGPELERRLRRRLKPTNDSWRVDETYIRSTKAEYRASHGDQPTPPWRSPACSQREILRRTVMLLATTDSERISKSENQIGTTALNHHVQYDLSCLSLGKPKNQKRTFRASPWSYQQRHSTYGLPHWPQTSPLRSCSALNFNASSNPLR